MEAWFECLSAILVFIPCTVLFVCLIAHRTNTNMFTMYMYNNEIIKLNTCKSCGSEVYSV